MATVQTVTCDAPGCGKDITRGNGRQWNMVAFSQVVGIQAGTTPRFDSGIVQPQVHFCDNRCLATWATAQADAADTQQAAFLAANAAKAAAPAAAAPAATSTIVPTMPTAEPAADTEKAAT